MFGRFLDNLFGKKNAETETSAVQKALELQAPLAGKYIPIKEVNDPVFSAEMLGKGVAIEPSSYVLLAPQAGKVTQVFSTGHAVTLQIGKAEVLLHIGIDTVNLQGQGFKPLVSADSEVKAGQALIEFDKAVIEAAGYPLTTMMVVCNHDQFAEFEVVAPSEVTAGVPMIKLA